MKKICVLTATRAEYGLLKPVIDKLAQVPEFDVRVAVTGAHLSPEHGLTYKEIEKDGIPIDKKIEILQDEDTPAAVSKAMGLALIGFAEYFAESNPDLLVVLGDRYETLAVCCAAMNARIPIAHLYGGETTEGAVDECVRHAITKLSHLHFTSTEEYRRRVIQLGEAPERVWDVGAIGVENVREVKLLARNELEEALGLDAGRPYAMVTFHPVTLENDTSEAQMKELLAVCDAHPEMEFVFSGVNADVGNRVIGRLIDEYISAHDNGIAFQSLGTIRYLSAVKYCEAVIGNSSSGLSEAPSLGVPTVNIGDRQKGRVRVDSVIDCSPTADGIEKALTLARSRAFREKALKTVNPYEGENTSDVIVEKIKESLLGGTIDLKKKFYDI